MNIKEDYHVHCNFNNHSAPDLTIRNVIKQGKEIGLQTLALTEHVRKCSEWIPNYLNEIESCLNTHNCMRIITGFEAKILIDGSIDCPEEYSKNYFLIS